MSHLVPTTVPPRARYRGPGEPHQINLFRNQLLYDMTRLYKAASMLNKDIVDELPVASSNSELVQKLAVLESHIRDLLRSRHR